MEARNVQERRNIMNLCRCENGHFYDTQPVHIVREEVQVTKNEQCPGGIKMEVMELRYL